MPPFSFPYAPNVPPDYSGLDWIALDGNGRQTPQKSSVLAGSWIRLDQPGKRSGGEGGIRTHVTVARKPHFECGAFDHSATSPRDKPTGPGRAPHGREARPLAALLALA